LCNDLKNISKRLKAREAKMAQDGIVLTKAPQKQDKKIAGNQIEFFSKRIRS
jgi:hypothetical protein